MSVLTIEELTVTSPKSVILQNIQLSIGPGERLGVIGESGSGKSVLALTIMGLLPPSLNAMGKVFVKDGLARDILTSDERELNSIRGNVVSIVFQEPSTALDPLMKIGRQIAEPLRRHKRLRGEALSKAVTASLAEVRIKNPARIAKSFPHEISGGERQRVAIAMALACQPDLLIADEPTTALDVTVQAEVLDLLDSLVEQHKMSLLFISHDLAVVKRITNKVVVLKAGEIVEAGSLDSILQRPTHPYTTDLVTNAIELDNALNFGRVI